MAYKIYNCNGLTGGASRDLDAISVAVLADGDRAMVCANDSFYFFVFAAASTAAESSPSRIRPNDYASAGVWENQSSPFGNTGPIVSTEVPIEENIRGGDVTVSGNILTISPVSCMDSTGVIRLYTAANTTVTLPGTVNGNFYVFITRLLDGVTFEPRAYSTEAGPESDAEIDAWRQRSFAKNNGAGVTMPYVQVKDRVDWISASNLPVLTASYTNSLVLYSIDTVIPASKIDVTLLSSQAFYWAHNNSADLGYVPATQALPGVTGTGIYLRGGTSGVVNITSTTLRL